jgi:hypothetical protein
VITPSIPRQRTTVSLCATAAAQNISENKPTFFIYKLSLSCLNWTRFGRATKTSDNTRVREDRNGEVTFLDHLCQVFVDAAYTILQAL